MVLKRKLFKIKSNERELEAETRYLDQIKILTQMSILESIWNAENR